MEMTEVQKLQQRIDDLRAALTTISTVDEATERRPGTMVLDIKVVASAAVAADDRAAK